MPRPYDIMPIDRHRLAVPLLFAGFVWFLIAVLGPAARQGWLGPVPQTNIETRLDAGALFYTEVDIDALRLAP